jgi:hypothetical protein
LKQKTPSKRTKSKSKPRPPSYPRPPSKTKSKRTKTSKITPKKSKITNRSKLKASTYGLSLHRQENSFKHALKKGKRRSKK